MVNVILLAPLYGNGGIASWTKKYIDTFPTEEFRLIPISSVLSSKNMQAPIYERLRKGGQEVGSIIKQLKKNIVENDVKILHTTTSGSLGTFRDYQVGKLCKKYGVKTIMHCRYGCIPDILEHNNFMRWALLQTMKYYDQIWVLDKYSFNALVSSQKLAHN